MDVNNTQKYFNGIEEGEIWGNLFWRFSLPRTLKPLFILTWVDSTYIIFNMQVEIDL